MTNEAQLTDKMAAALTTVALACVTAPATEYCEAGEVMLDDLRAAGAGIAQLNALTRRGFLNCRQGVFVPTRGPYAGQEVGERYYSVA